jgi:hypothetical protein
MHIQIDTCTYECVFFYVFIDKYIYIYIYTCMNKYIGYIKEMASRSGLEVLSCNEVPLRSDGGVPINGYIYVLERST